MTMDDSSYEAHGHSLISGTFRANVSGKVLSTVSPAEVQGVQSVFPPDTRRPVKDTTEFPWSAMGQLVVDFPNGDRYTGTGVLVDNSHVLTAAHNLFGSELGGWARTVWFIRARNGDKEPFGIFEAERVFITEEYKKLSPPDPNFNKDGTVVDYTLYTEDYGVVRLKDSVKIPILGMFAANNLQLKTQISITGYPGDKPPNSMWTDTNDVTYVDDHFLFYRVNTYRGESGAGIIAELEQPIGRSIVGVHVAGAPELKSNFGVRLTSTILKQVQKWMNFEALQELGKDCIAKSP